MPFGITRAVSISLLLSLAGSAASQSEEFHGQASGWLTADPESPLRLQAGVRYIPDFLLEQRLSGVFNAGMELSLNSYALGGISEQQPPSHEENVKLYRAWLRISSDRFEARAGLQKINFGSAQLLRPLMWFDRIDPRDPLQLTEGVYGVLARYYFQDNVNAWLWALYGNNNPKGWESAPTDRKSIEYGGRVQSPLASGEIGLTYHHRRADYGGSPAAPEDRLALDGKWDIGPGVWFEGVMTHHLSSSLMPEYGRQWTLGADYTFAAGNGIYAAAEYFRTDNSLAPFGAGAGDGFSALSLAYPIGNVDRISAILYRDWAGNRWYRIASWQRTLDNWTLYLLGFWNPDSSQLFQGAAGAASFAGAGFQVMVTYNH